MRPFRAVPKRVALLFLGTDGPPEGPQSAARCDFLFDGRLGAGGAGPADKDHQERRLHGNDEGADDERADAEGRAELVNVAVGLGGPGGQPAADPDYLAEQAMQFTRAARSMEEE